LSRGHPSATAGTSLRRADNEEIKVSRSLKLSALALACGAVFAAQPAAAAADVERVMGSDLLQLVQESEAADAALPQHLSGYLHDAKGNVLVHLHLKNSADAHPHLSTLAAAGLKDQVVSRVDPSHVEGYVSLRDVRRLVGLDVVRSVALTRTPVRFAGSVQSQAVALEKADIAQKHGFDGTGIRIGALSDSYDACAGCATHAADDIASGDLPADGVTVIQEDPHVTSATDEGRAMLQLIHDLAPGSQLGFATAFSGEIRFANNILALRETFGADVITDDVIYFNEPMYSDGLVARAVDKVVSEGAAYFSSAGNNGLDAYEAQYEPLPWSEALKLAQAGFTPLRLDQIPDVLVPRSVHIFNGHSTKGTGPAIGNRMTVIEETRVVLQWDEPFFLDKVKTDYNIYIFDNKGNWIKPHGGGHGGVKWPVKYTADDNIATDQPIEGAELFPNGEIVKGGTAQNDYYIMIGKMNDGPAQKIKYVAVNTLAPAQYQGSPSIWGHTAAATGQSVAATYYGIPNMPEDFSASGPVTIEFDTDGNPLPQPVTRNVPQITAADGVDTTFFGFDADLNGLPNFFGTSAAAPDAAGVAALVLQAAGGPGSMAPADVYTTMQQTARQIPVANERNRSHADAGPVKLQMADDWTRWGNYFELKLDPSASSAVASVVLDMSGTNGPLVFNPILTRFYLGASHGVTMADITYSVSADQSQATLVFAPGSFAPGDHFHFGTSVFNPLQGTTQEDADRMRGLVLTVTMEDGTSFQGTVTAQQTRGVNRWTGAGLVDAAAAIRSIVKD
jgi:hypothetical protein